MGIFGWDYPPGCSGTPFDDPRFCDVCGKDAESSRDGCICHECPECGEVGRPECYEEHGMTRTPEQIASFEAMTTDPGPDYADGADLLGGIDED